MINFLWRALALFSSPGSMKHRLYNAIVDLRRKLNQSDKLIHCLQGAGLPNDHEILVEYLMLVFRNDPSRLVLRHVEEMHATVVISFIHQATACDCPKCADVALAYLQPVIGLGAITRKQAAEAMRTCVRMITSPKAARPVFVNSDRGFVNPDVE